MTRPNRHADEMRAAAIDDYATGLSAKEVSRKHHLSEGTVLAWVRAAGITRPRGGGSNRVTTEKRTAALADLADSGDPLARVAARHGISPTVLAQWRDTEADHAFTGTWVRDGLVWRAAPAAEVEISMAPAGVVQCLTCNGSGEVWDGYRREHDTGQPVTHECRDCLGTGEDPA